MSDKELIAFLRDLPFLRAAAAADRIEELTKLLATTKDTLNICRAANADMAESVEGFFQERDELTEQLEAARADAKEAEAYAEELEKERYYTEGTNEVLRGENQRLEAKLATCEKYRDAYAECDSIGTQAVRDLEAKLEKAVEALRKIGKTYSADGSRLIHSDKQIINMVYIVLAEIEGLGVKQTG